MHAAYITRICVCEPAADRSPSPSFTMSHCPMLPTLICDGVGLGPSARVGRMLRPNVREWSLRQRVHRKRSQNSSLCCRCSHLALARPDLWVGHWEPGLVDALRGRVGHRVAAVACRRRVRAGRLRTSACCVRAQRYTARLGHTDESEL